MISILQAGFSRVLAVAKPYKNTLYLQILYCWLSQPYTEQPNRKDWITPYSFWNQRIVFHLQCRQWQRSSTKPTVRFPSQVLKVSFSPPLYQCLAVQLLTFLQANREAFSIESSWFPVKWPLICSRVTVLSSFWSLPLAAFTHFLLLCSSCFIKFLIICFFVSDHFKFLHLLPAVFLVNRGLSCYSRQINNLCLTFGLYAVV